MLDGKKIIVVMPAYNAADTLEISVNEIPSIVDEIIVVDDCSTDGTKKVAEELNVHYHRHNNNLGYGGNQKTCYELALKKGGDIIIMVHPDYQYSPKLVTAMAAMLVSDHYDIVLASRIIGDQTSRKSAMPLWRYIANRFLTFAQNILMEYKLSEYHTGFRAYSKKVLEKLPIEIYSNDFIFDNQLLANAINEGFRLGEISCPTSYHDKASSINLRRSVKYGLGVLYVSLTFALNRKLSKTKK